MHVSIITLLFFSLIGSASASAQALLVRNVTVVSGDKSTVVPNRSVLIEDGMISAILDMDTPVSADTVLEGNGRFLIPGLIDSHVHLGSEAGMRGPDARANSDLVDEFRAREPLNYLAFGFTTLVDVSASQQFADRWNDLPLRPDLHFCISIPFANGYGMAFAPEETRFNTPYFLYDAAQAEVIPPQHNPADHTPASVIAKVVLTDAVCVKTYFETGFGGLFDFPVPDIELIRQVVDGAHQHGLTVLMHANALEGQQFAVYAGVDVIAHGAWHWDEWNSTRELVPPVKNILDQVIANDIATQVTAQVIYGERDLLDPTYLDNPRLLQVYAPGLMHWYKSDEGGWFKRQLEKTYRENQDIVARFIGHESTGPTDEATNAGIDRLKSAVSYLANEKAGFVFGTDTPSSPTFTNPPGLNGLQEIYRLRELGLDEQQIFAALTIKNARVFGLDGEIGTITVGKKANLLLLRENPLESVLAYDTIETIVLGGKLLSLKDLAKSIESTHMIP